MRNSRPFMIPDLEENMKNNAILFAICWLSASTANAAIVTYTGNPFDRFGANSGPGNIVAAFDISVPLTAGAVITQADMNSWSMSAAGRTIENTGATFVSIQLDIGPDLLPATWIFGAEQNLEGHANPETIASHRNGVNTPVDSLLLNDQWIGHLSGNGDSADSSTNIRRPGTWTVSAVPEPSPFLYLGLAAVVAGWFRRIVRSLV